MRLPKLDIIVPVYNEGENINKLYASICSSLNEHADWRAYIVYDFDEDTTRPVAENLNKKDPRIVPTRQTFGKGALNALKYGFSIIHDDAVIVVMGDCSDDLNTIPRMLEEIKNGATIVTSSRFIKGGGYQGGSFIKKNLSRTAGFILWIFGIGTNDPTNNFKMYSGRWIKSVNIESKGGFEIALEFVVKASLNKLKIVQIPGVWMDRTIGESKFELKKLLPHYFRWFAYYLKMKLIG